MPQICIIKNGKYFFVPSDNYETRESTLDRAWFIANECPKSTEEFQNYIMESRKMRNIKLCHCGYE